MSAWGKLDRLELITNAIYTTAYANVINGSNVIYTYTGNTGSAVSAPIFTSTNVQPGYSIVLANVNYRVQKVDANAAYVTIDIGYQGTSANITDVAVQQSPKFIKNTLGWAYANTNGRYNQANLYSSNTQSKRTVYGVDRVEANVVGNRANGFKTVGWVEYHTYTNAAGNVRHKVNTLVAASKNFNANATGVLQVDANDNGYIRNTQ
jgi:hypothetical protein